MLFRSRQWVGQGGDALRRRPQDPRCSPGPAELPARLLAEDRPRLCGSTTTSPGEWWRSCAVIAERRWLRPGSIAVRADLEGVDGPARAAWRRGTSLPMGHEEDRGDERKSAAIVDPLGQALCAARAIDQGPRCRPLVDGRIPGPRADFGRHNHLRMSRAAGDTGTGRAGRPPGLECTGAELDACAQHAHRGASHVKTCAARRRVHLVVPVCA